MPKLIRFASKIPISDERQAQRQVRGIIESHNMEDGGAGGYLEEFSVSSMIPVLIVLPALPLRCE